METKHIAKTRSTQEVANTWAEMCKLGQFMECVDVLYAENIVSKEMAGTPDDVVSGKQNVIDKSNKWLESVQEFHSADVSVPVIAQNHFTSIMSLDVTFKEIGRQLMEEVCVFEVKDGEIINEQFFYSL